MFNVDMGDISDDGGRETSKMTQVHENDDGRNDKTLFFFPLKVKVVAVLEHIHMLQWWYKIKWKWLLSVHLSRLSD